MLDLTVMSTWQQTSEALSSYKVKPVKLWLQFLLPAHCSPTYFRALKTHRKRNLFQEKHKQVYQIWLIWRFGFIILGHDLSSKRNMT